LCDASDRTSANSSPVIDCLAPFFSPPFQFRLQVPAFLPWFSVSYFCFSTAEDTFHFSEVTKSHVCFNLGSPQPVWFTFLGFPPNLPHDAVSFLSRIFLRFLGLPQWCPLPPPPPPPLITSTPPHRCYSPYCGS